VTNSFFVISFLPTLCSQFEVGRRFSECSAEYYIRESSMFRRRFAECSARRFAECSAEYYIREGGLGYTYMEITSPIYDTM
jgi:hypothetical protein